MKKAFELRKIIVAAVLGCFLFHGTAFAAPVSDEVFQDGVDAYRKGDIQECCNTMNVLKKKDPTNAYVAYYLAMSNAKLGNLDAAKENYEAVIMLNQDPQLVSYAQEGIRNIENATGKKEEKKEFFKKDSSGTDKLSLKAQGNEKKANVSDEEIAKAIKVLRDAGLLNVNVTVGSAAVTPATAVTPSNGMDAATMLKQNSELMNLNMMMGSMGGSKSSGMDMLPFMMMQQNASGGKSNISPEVLQMMMNNSMLEGMSAFDTDNKDK